jgi:folate-binding Fe-S cluster repair protein YgfZ
MVNLELVGGVNFQKGCYPGQEIVARSQYRGTLKRRGFVAAADAPLAAGAEVVHSDDPTQPAGLVALAASAYGHHAALLELKLAAADTGSLRAGSVDGPLLRLGTLPYVIPTEAA